jgi:predicted O-methyltransferase YrrM
MPFSKLKTPVPESGATGITTKQNMQFQIDGKYAFHCIGPPPGQRHYYCRWRTGSGAWPEQLHISPSDDWFGPGHLQNWEPLLSMHAGKKLPLRRCKCCPMRPEPGPDAQPVAALELGSWEGNSTAWIASHMCWHKDSVLVAVDDWSWANQFSEDEETKARRIADLAQVEQRFDANILAASEAEGGCGKVIKRKGNTQTVLPELQKEDLRFDFCYIDASHAPEDVLRDAVLAWPLVKSGGIIIFDDYGKHDYESETCPIAYQSQMENKPSYCSTHGWFGPAMDPAWNGPPGCRCTGRGVDAFLACYGKFCKVIDCKYQIALLKL